MQSKKKRVAVTISMPRDMAEEYDSLSKQMAKNRSVLFREMFLVFKKQTLEKEFRELQSYGVARAREKELFSESDVEKLVFQRR